MKKQLILCLFLLLLTPQPAKAHILKTSGTVGAVMHITPDDDPVVGAKSTFYFQIKEKEGDFSPDNCDCSISIEQSDKKVFSQPLFQKNPRPSLENVSFSYVFPQKGVYTITIKGKPVNRSAFQPFTLRFVIQVDREKKALQSTQNSFIDWTSKHVLHLFGAFLIAFFVVVAIIRERLML